MANGGALIGLTANTNKRESARADLATLGQLYNMKKQEEAEEQQAQATEAQFYEDIRAKADELLAGDRERINKRAAALRADVKERIRLLGGSRSKFFNNGGIATLSKYREDVLGSHEMQVYKQNKVNLERILAVKEKGMGHLLTPQDQQALEEYYANGQGIIKYSGLMNEIEMPDPMAFDYGKQMTPSDIMDWGNNKMKLVANMALEDPDLDPTKVTRKQVLEYVISKGYGGRGKARDPYANRGSRTRTGDDKDTTKYTISGMYNDWISGLTSVPIGKLDQTAWKDNAYSDIIFGKDNTFGISAFGSDPSALVDFTDNEYRMRNAKKNQQVVTDAWVKAVHGDQVLYEDGFVKNMSIDPEKVYLPNGEQLKFVQDERNSFWTWFRDKNKAEIGGDLDEVKVVTSGVGWTAIDSDGKKNFIVDNMENGKIEKDAANPMFDNPNLQATPTGFIMYETEDWMGNKRHFYQEVDIKTVVGQSAFGQNLGEYNDVKAQTEEQQQKQAVRNAAETQAEADYDAKPKREDPNDDAFSSNVFRMQNSDYNSQAGGKRLEPLRKAFYLALSDSMPNVDLNQAINEDLFGEFMGKGNAVMSPYSANPNVNEFQLIELFYKSQEQKNPSQENLVFKKRLENYLNLIYKK